ncbi:MAG: class I SAM-dependent methyltransferase [Pseudobdellovibrionaceae bacterium]
MIKNRILKNLQRLKSWVSQNQIQAYRIYDWDIPEYPFQIDLYGSTCLIHDKSFSDSERDQKHLQETYLALQQIFDIPETSIIFKKRFQQREKDKSQQYEKLNQTNQKIPVQEGALKFYVNLNDYIDTGLFLDHRPLRKMILQRTIGNGALRFLNLFAYTCSLSVAAAKAGMHTVSVDLSEKYLNWGQDNFQLNELDPKKHSFLALNALEFLKYGYQNTAVESEFDLIFLDPPTFSNSKKMSEDFEVERDQIQLIENTMRFLKSDGLLIFSNNKRTFKLEKVITEKFKVKDISMETIPMDFQKKKIHQCYEIRHQNI